MKEKSEIIGEAKEIILRRRLENENNFREYREKLLENIPELEEISKEMTSNGAKLGRLAISGKSGSEEYAETLQAMNNLQNKQKEVLKNNGISEDSLECKYFCKKCNDTGLCNNVICDCLREAINDVTLKESGIPYKAGFESFNENIYSDADKASARDTLEIAKKCVENFPKDSKFFILGKTGVGKTYLASMIGTELTRKGVYAVYVTLPELMRTLLYYGDDSRLTRERDNMRGIIKDAEMLIIDELGTEKLSDAKQDILSSLIDKRIYEDQKGTMVITNNSLREILENYGERIFSRLSTMKIVNIELSEGKDLRQKINAK